MVVGLGAVDRLGSVFITLLSLNCVTEKVSMFAVEVTTSVFLKYSNVESVTKCLLEAL
jgi:hypothetical protein